MQETTDQARLSRRQPIAASKRESTPWYSPGSYPLFPFPCFFSALGTHNSMAGILHLSNSTLPSSELQEHMAPILRAHHARIAGFAGPVRAKQYDRFDGFMPPPSAQRCFVSLVSSSPLPPGSVCCRDGMAESPSLVSASREVHKT